MINEQPTQEQIREFWEKFGFRFCQPVEGGAVDVLYPDGSLCLSPSKIAIPPIDLNTLFKYAVPKLFEQDVDLKLYSEDEYWFCYILKRFTNKIIHYTIGYLDPTLALFWALWQAKESRK